MQAAIAALGGIETFVKPGDDVIIKPNICTDYYTYEYAATTNPDVVAELVRMSIGAGAKRVRVMDNPFGGTSQKRTTGISANSNCNIRSEFFDNLISKKNTSQKII